MLVFNTITGDYVDKFKKTDLYDMFRVGKNLLCLYFAGTIKCLDMGTDEMFTVPNLYNLEKGWSFMQVTAQTETATTVRFGSGGKDIIFNEEELLPYNLHT